MTGPDFDFVADLLKKRAGIVLTADKTYLLESRLAPLARKEGLPSIDDLIAVVRTRREAVARRPHIYLPDRFVHHRVAQVFAQPHRP